MRRLLLDQGLAPLADELLRDIGWEAVHVSEIAMHRAEDGEILTYAREDDRVCITLDHDFHAHLAMAGLGRPSVVFLRIKGLDARRQADLIRLVYLACEEALLSGAAVSAELETIRVRRLPLR